MPGDVPFSKRSSPAELISLIIPCYNEEEVLPLLFDRISNTAAVWQSPIEIILVDDGSSDRTWAMICERNAIDPRWKGIRLGRNFGHQAALWAGLRHATGEIIAILDADLQDPPEVLPAFFSKWEEGYDVIYAIRTHRKESFPKRCAYWLFYRILALLSETRIPLDSGDFCVLDRRVVQAMLQTEEPQPFIRGLRAWVGFQQLGLTYERAPRAAGEVKYTLRKLVKLATDGIISSSRRPLHIATTLGLLGIAFAILGLGVTVVKEVSAESIERAANGNGLLSWAILFLASVQLVCLGILGEYVGRIYETVKGRPTPTIASRVGIAPPPSN